MEGPKAIIAEVCKDEGHAVLECEVAWLSDAPFLAKSNFSEIHHAESDALFADVMSLEPGDQVCQYRCLADLPEVITALAKTEAASAVQHYRFITVLSLCYCIWGSIRGRQALRHLSAVAPRNLQGGMPGRSAPESWWQLQRNIDGPCQSVQHPAEDTRVCIGHPNRPSSWLGAGLEWCCLWMFKTFQDKKLGWTGFLACTGFPAGDALSVVSMVLVDLALLAFVQRSIPAASLTTFVDDYWKTSASNASVRFRHARPLPNHGTWLSTAKSPWVGISLAV